jgi:short-subunit dehydrogenase
MKLTFEQKLSQKNNKHNIKHQSTHMGKTILITGAGSGIGKDTAFALAQRGHRVLATTQTDAQALSLKQDARTHHVVLEVFKLDITLEHDRAKLMSYDLDVLINNAAIGESGSLAEVDMKRVRQLFEVNLFCTLELTQVALRNMIKRESGTVLLVSSIAGRVPMPFLMPYSMSKFALSAAGAGLRAEMDQLKKNIHISLIEPGAIHTGFNQAMTDSKYAWMGSSSYFAHQAEKMQKQERATFKLLEARSTQGIVKQIVKASEANRPKLRYVSPWIQGFGIRMARIFGV